MYLGQQRTVRILEQNLAIDTARTDQCRIQRLDLVRGHDDLDITSVIETVQLVQQLQHSALDLTLSSACRFVTLCTNRIDLINEYNCRRVVSGHLEELADQTWTVSKILLDKF